MALLEVGNSEDAENSATKAIELAPEEDLKITPLLLRTHIRLRNGRNAEASNDLLEAWKINPKELIEDVEHHALMEAVYVRSENAETVLFWFELCCAKAARESDANPKHFEETLNEAMEILVRLKPLKEVDEEQIPCSVRGELVYDVLSRCASRLAESTHPDLAIEQIEKMQNWVMSIFNEPFDSLSDQIAELRSR